MKMCCCLTTCFVQLKDDEIPEGDDAGRDTQVEASAAKTAATARTTEGGAQAEVSVVEMAAADAVMTHHKAEIPQLMEV
jgi:hypothetical protein